jgi:hypothetical protein
LRQPIPGRQDYPPDLKEHDAADAETIESA